MTATPDPPDEPGGAAPAPDPDEPLAGETGPVRVVGIGASAGGLEAFEQFFPAVPAATGLAFVVVQHLDPTKTGILPELIGRMTPMPVAEAEDGMAIEPDHVYVVPPNRYLTVEEGRLRLRELQGGTHVQMSVDALFRSLAEDQRDRAVAVVLSGMGTDGTLGIAAVKEQFGLVLVQEPTSAPFDGMPHSAVGTGLPDYVAPAGELPGLLLEHIEREQAIAPAREPSSEETCARILALLRSRTGHDFSLYKANTVRRRIQRRMAVHRIERLAGYLEYLRENQGEVVLLFRELLIGVTQFFRDPEAWDVLRDRVLPELLLQRPPDAPFRAWVPGCSTGEEAFSLAIVLLEALDATGEDRGVEVQVFATDIDAQAIAAARQAVYPPNIEADVSPERLARFFSRQEDGSYRVRKEARELVVFAEQDVVADPPFTRLDLLCCRNLLIYFSPELQQRVLPVFHYSLLPGGILFLGSAETVGAAAGRFETVDPKWKIYRRAGGPAPFPEPFAVPRPRHPQGLARAGRTRGQALADRLQALLLRDYAAPGVVVNERGDVLHVSGRIGRYLEPPPGRATHNIFAMARDGLGIGIETALHRAYREHEPVRAEGLPLETDGATVPVDVLVRPAGEAPDLRDLMIVVFEEPPRSAHAAAAESAGEPPGWCEEELRRARERLQSTVEAMEASREDVQSAYEEMQSTNEELQSTNEELTTSKEELQSLNEELVTVNQELQRKIGELSKANNDVRNLLDATDIATLFLDRDLRIQRFTAPAKGVLNLIPSDMGRPVRDIALNLRYDRLAEDAREVLATLVPVERQVESGDGRWFLVRARPYRTVESAIEGVVFTFTEITAVKRLELELLQSREWLAQAQRIGHLGSWRWDIANDRVTVSDEWFRIYGLPVRDEAPPFAEFAALAAPERDLREVVREAMDGPVALEFLLTRPGGETRLIAATVRAAPAGGEPVEAIGAVLDITDRMRAEEELRTAHARLALASGACPARLFQQDRALRYVWVLGPPIPGTPDPLVGRTDADFLPPPEAHRLAAIKEGVIATGEPARTRTVRLQEGRTFAFDEEYEPWRDTYGTVVGITGRVVPVPEDGAGPAA